MPGPLNLSPDLQFAFFEYEDTSGKMDSTDEINKEFTKRQELIAEREIEMIGHLHGDLFNQ